MISRQKIRDRVLYELKAGISPNRELVRAIELAIDYTLEEIGETPDNTGRI